MRITKDPVAPPPLGVVSLPGSTAYPPHPAHEPHRLHLGVLRADGTLLESTIDDRHHGEHLFIPPDASRFASLDSTAPEAIYAGMLHDVYGHFILESCQRLWWAAAHPDLPIVWVAPESAPTTLNQWQRDLLEILGVRNEVIVVKEATRFDLLHVPDAGYKYADWCHPQHIDFLAAHPGPPMETGSKLWLSLDSRHGRGVVNRHIIERRLRDLGWTIATFETMSVRDQLDALARAEVIAGEEASTFHNLLLLTDIRGKRFHVFRRYGPEHLSFTTIGEARQVDQQIHSCGRDAVVSVRGRAVVRLAPNPAQYLSHLEIRVPRPGKLPPDWRPGHTIRRLNRLARILDASTLLQVGWRRSTLFTQVAIPTHDVVDEEFTFDVRSFRGAQFYEVTLEQFLDHFAEGRTYDLVMLDDQHHWRDALQRLRTVLTSAAHDRTVVVLDNVMPLDEIAATPDLETALRLRRESGGEPQAWQGDVFKAVFAVHDLHPELTYRTITTRGNPQTVIWRQARRAEPRFAGESAIESLTYADVQRHLDLFVTVTENEAMNDVRAWSGGDPVGPPSVG